MGLSPEYYNNCTDDVLNLYAELEDRIISDVVRRIVKTGDITETAKWQIRQAQQMGLLYDDIIKDIAKSTNKTDSEVKKMFEKAGVETVNNDNRLHIQAGKSPLDIRQSESMLQILNGVYKNSLTDLKNLTGTTAITSQTAYYQACNSAFMMVSSGAFSYQQALRTVIQEVADKGATVSYPSGHIDKLDVAVRRSLLTGIGLASRQISEENSRLCECDLMEISAHSGARPSHAVWQGQIVSLSGRRGYLSKSDIGYGTGAGFGGWNCRHDWYPFYEGISTRNYPQKDLDRLNAKDIKYNGKMYSEYEISQMLRKKEREIRALKREQVAYKTALSETDEKELKTVFQSALTYTNSVIRNKSNQIQEFCNQTGYKRDRFREQVGSKTSVGHNSNKNNENISIYRLTSNNENGKMSSGNVLTPTEYRAKIKEAENYAKKLGIRNVSYNNVDLGVANAWNKFLEENFKKFPVTKNYINFIGDVYTRNSMVEKILTKKHINKLLESNKNISYKELQEKAKSNVAKDMETYFKINPKEKASTWIPKGAIYKSVSGIYINGIGCGSIENINNTNLRNSNNKFYPIGCITIKSTFDHEFGHLLDTILDIRNDERIHDLFAPYIKNPALLTDDLSEYAWNNARTNYILDLYNTNNYKSLSDIPNFTNLYLEFIAEGWAEYCNNPNPRKIAKSIGDIIEQTYKIRFNEGNSNE